MFNFQKSLYGSTIIVQLQYIQEHKIILKMTFKCNFYVNLDSPYYKFDMNKVIKILKKHTKFNHEFQLILSH